LQLHFLDIANDGIIMSLFWLMRWRKNDWVVDVDAGMDGGGWKRYDEWVSWASGLRYSPAIVFSIFCIIKWGQKKDYYVLHNPTCFNHLRPQIDNLVHKKGDLRWVIRNILGIQRNILDLSAGIERATASEKETIREGGMQWGRGRGR
jgi:hypothetical protein